MKKLTGKVVVITGASSGVGRAMAIEFTRQGAKLVLAARRSQALREVADECTALGGIVHAAVTDTRNANEVQQLARAAYDFAGAIDVWINNAGVLAAGALDQVPAEVNENVLQTNLLGYIHGAQQVLPYFKAQGRGILINNISIGGWFPTPYATAYSASKFGLRGFSEALKGELSDYPGIHVVDLYPAFLDTPGIAHAANYTGKVIRPAPPVYDPRKVARAITELIVSPKPRKMIGATSCLLRMGYALFPSLSRNLTAITIRKYLRSAKDIEFTSGNVISPVEFGTGIDGVWRARPLPRKAKLAGVFAASLLLGVFIGMRR